MKKSVNSQPSSLKHGVKLIALVLTLMFFGRLLLGCSTTSIKPIADCPKAPDIPETLAQSDSQSVSALSKDLMKLRAEASDWLKTLP